MKLAECWVDGLNLQNHSPKQNPAEKAGFYYERNDTAERERDLSYCCSYRPASC